MNLLLDSHTFVWWRDEPHKLSHIAFAEISNPNNDVFLSVVTVWELQIKIALNKFTIKGKLENAVKDEQQNNGFQILPIQVSHALYLENLPPHHKDPFDRLLISQAIVENMTLVSADKDFAKYQVNLLW
ncbi:MAG: type II toxin-antitoxin system VapC family toxin [Acidobacteria bacterium]|nr:type II toxin-antitoxin system VapC family toxin [Acidobacteriota bacterium]